MAKKVKTSLPRKRLFLFVGALVLLLSVINFSLWTRNYLTRNTRRDVEKEIIFWENLVSQIPTYRDGYLKLAILYNRLGNASKAKESLQKAIDIDPNHGKVSDLKETLGF